MNLFQLFILYLQNGWDPNEMFAKNEKVYGVTSNFEQDLSQYTIKLERKDSAEFK